jgi:hypothetical protein
LVEHSLGKGEVTSSILVIGSRDGRTDACLEVVLFVGGTADGQGKAGKGAASAALQRVAMESGFAAEVFES